MSPLTEFFIQLIAAELGLAVLLLAVIVATEVYSNIEFRRSSHQSSRGLGGLKFVEVLGGPPPVESKEGEEIEDATGSGKYL